MKLATSGGLGILFLIPGAGGSIPDAGSFYNKVKEFLDGTPSNLMVEVWNEPNNQFFGNLSPTKCRELIGAAWWADAGRGRLIGPSMAPTGNWGQYMIDAYADHLVPAAVHIYPHSNPWWLHFDDAIKTAQLANGAAKPIYITEMALRHTWRNGQNQVATLYGGQWAQYSRDAYTRSLQYSDVRAVIFHRLWQDFGANQTEFDNNGLTYFLDVFNGETQLVDRLDEVR